MSRPLRSQTPATAFLRACGVAFAEHEYDYVEGGGAAASAAALGVPEHAVVKTLVFEDEQRRPLLVLMHGDCTVSTKALARSIGCKRVASCAPRDAERHTGYRVGGTSPFATRKALPVYLERSVLALERVWINGGRRGLLVSLDPRELVRTLAPRLVQVARPRATPDAARS